MKITIDIDEQDIIKSALAGLNKKEIKKKVIEDVTSSVVDTLRNNITSKVYALASKDDSNTFKKIILEGVQKQMKKSYSPSKIISMFKKDQWQGFMEDVIQPIMTDFVERALSDWMTIGVTVKGKKKDQFVELCGTDSYTHRKK